MKIAILGATGQIGRCLALAYSKPAIVTLFARNIHAAQAFVQSYDLSAEVAGYDRLSDGDFDLIINALGNGVPGDIRRAGASILDITAHYDRLCVDYLTRHPDCSYIFLSTGAIYGAEYEQARKPNPVIKIPLGQTADGLYYPIAKRLAELRHRDTPDLKIADIRIFGFVSTQMDLTSDFLVAQILQATLTGTTFDTRREDVVRDYIGPDDLTGLIDQLVRHSTPNGAYDILSAAPTSKFRILEALANEHGLSYTIDGVCGSGLQAPLPGRLSNNLATERVGFSPKSTSLDNIIFMAENRAAPQA